MTSRRTLPLVLLGLGCAPSLDADLSMVSEPRILALRAEPAEAKEGQSVSLSALIADPEAGELSAEFELCAVRKNLTELGPIAPECLSAQKGAVVPLGSGTRVSATVSTDACRLFGPLRPDPKPGEPAGRPADADTTGGYHQPVVAYLEPSSPVLGAIRLNCGLVQADREKVEAYNLRWTPNTNPALETLYIQSDADWEALDAESSEPFLATRGTRYRLKAEWPACPIKHASAAGDTSKAEPCAGEENYLYYAQGSQSLEERVESISTAWYASDGSFGARRSVATAQASENEWTAPSSFGSVRLWVVLRDGRGGVGWASYRFEVQ